MEKVYHETDKLHERSKYQQAEKGHTQMKTRQMLLTAVVVVAVGAAAIAVWMASKNVSASKVELQKAMDRAGNAERDLKTAKDEIQKLERKLLAAERRRKEDVRSAEAAAAAPAIEPEQEMPAADAIEPQPPEPANDADQPQDRRRGRDGEQRGGARTPEEEAQRAEFRRQFVENMRTQASSFIQQNIDASADAASQQRLASIGQYLDSMFEQGQQMRDAQSDEEREQIRQNMRQNGEELQGLVRQQQDSMLRGLAEQYGITDANKQNAIIDSINQLRQNPFFAFDPGQFMGAAGAVGGFGGGPGGFGGMGMFGGRGMRGGRGGR
jgi:hypothetical protein